MQPGGAVSGDWVEDLKGRIRAGRIREALALLDDHPDDRRAVVWLHRAELARMAGEDAGPALQRGWDAVDPRAEPDTAVNIAILAMQDKLPVTQERAWLERAASVAEAADDDSLRGLVAGQRAGVATQAGALDVALEHAQEAVRLQIARGGIRLALAHQVLGRVQFYRNAYDEAAEALQTATDLFLANGQQLGAATLWHIVASLHLLAGRPQLALDLTTAHIAQARRTGFLVTVPNLLLIQAGAWQALGDPERAIAVAEEAAAAGVESSPEIARMARATQGVYLVHAGRWDVARERTETVVAEVRDTEPQAADVFGSALLAVYARDGDRMGFDRVMAGIHRVEAHLGFIEADMAGMAELAATSWMAPTAARDDLGRAATALAYVARFHANRGTTQGMVRAHERLAELARRGAPLPIGRWMLAERLGAGAMGEVWRGYDATTGEEVAVKLLSAPGASRRRLELVDNEIRAVAALDHPSIAALLDTGRVPAYLEDVTGGRVPASSPYLVLEYVEGTTLDPWCGRMRWPEMRQTLLRLLDALAHAHAHGVLHLDVKPDNVLVDREGRVKLTDFGVSRVTEAGGPGHVAGTPAFMAPEQFAGRWRDYGPWTDLYALGGLSWALATGGPVFGTPTVERARAAHLGESPPSFQPRVDVPSGLEGWLQRLLDKAPRARFRRAADAAYALAQLGDRRQTAFLSPPTGSSTPTIAPDSAFLPSAPPAATTRVPGSSGAAPTLVLPPLDAAPPPPIAQPAGATLAPACPPPLPASWRRAELAPPTAAGLRLLALRHRRVVGRAHERSLLWAALRDATVGTRARSVLLTGAPGMGRTCLARWLANRAHEVGAATVLSAHRTDADPVAALLHRALGSEGLQGAELEARIDRRVDELGDDTHGRDRLRAALLPGAPLADRVVGLTWLVGRRARFRPTLLVLDDLHDHPDLQVLASTLVHLDAPLVVLGTGVDLDPAWIDHLDPLLLELGPLDPARALELVHGMVPLEDELCVEVAEAAAGNPHLTELAVQLLIERDGVVQEDRRLVLRHGFAIDPPPDLIAAWTERITRLGKRHGEALRDAAALGLSFERRAWARPDALEVAALDLGVLVRRGERLAFLHDVARQAAAGA